MYNDYLHYNNSPEEYRLNSMYNDNLHYNNSPEGYRLNSMYNDNLHYNNSPEGLMETVEMSFWEIDRVCI